MTPERTAPRSYAPLTEEERRRRAESTGGEPMLDSAAANDSESTAYIGYHHVDVLLDLQHPRTGEPAELPFCITGQIQELLFKLLFTEVNRIWDLLLADDLDEALRHLRRVEGVQRVLTTTWESLSTITPTEFAAFRDQLGLGLGCPVLHVPATRIRARQQGAPDGGTVPAGGLGVRAGHGRAAGTESVRRGALRPPAPRPGRPGPLRGAGLRRAVPAERRGRTGLT
ncbi:tryptophan 2,3-dioxygenase family protein [Streptomyces sp. NPDC047002]|uniref:tryptophan 2,3-dioxygenase family protein n=1 Tax=Streptomyces sp. NPDC047002 TaxID=3155475 RepID=UPI003452CD44